MVNIFGFVGHMVSVSATQLGCSVEAAIDSASPDGCSNKTLMVQTGICLGVALNLL